MKQVNSLAARSIATDDTTPSIGTYIGYVRARKWLVISATLLVSVLATALVNFLPPIYRSTTTILIENVKTSGASPSSGEVLDSRETAQTQVEFIRSRQVAVRVVDQMDLATVPFFNSTATPVKPVGVAASKIAALLQQASVDRHFTSEEVKELVVEKFGDYLDVVPIERTRLIEVRFELPDPELAAAIANRTAESYIKTDLDARLAAHQLSSQWLQEQLGQLRDSLRKSEVALQAYREQVGLVSTQPSSNGVNSKALDATSERLLAARVERTRTEETLKQVTRGSTSKYDSPAVFNHPAVQSARAQESNAQKRLTEASQTLGASHPEYRAALTALEAAKADTKRQGDSVIASIVKQYEVARSTEVALEKAVAGEEGDIRALNRQEGQFSVLERDVESNKEIYHSFLSRLREADAASGFLAPVARVVDKAVPALKPIAPKKAQIVVLATLIAAMLSSALVIFLERNSSVVRSTADVRDKLDLPLLVAVPLVTDPQVNLRRLQFDQPRSLFSEAVRSALTAVRLSLLNEARPVIAFTSILPGEGKSTLALNYAIEQARTKRTVLVDADMRIPRIGAMLGYAGSTAGMSEFFSGSDLSACIHHCQEFDLCVVPAGSSIESPHDLLLSPRFAQLIADLRERFDVVLIDTPPLELVSDALPIGLAATGMVLVVRAASTPVPLILRGLERLEASNVRCLGVVLNAHDFVRAGRYYGEYSAVSSYSGKYYGEEAHHRSRS